MQIITSRKNQIVGTFRSLARARAPKEQRILLDGIHLIEEARMAGLPILIAAISSKQIESQKNIYRQIIDDLVSSGTEVVQVAETVAAALSPVRSSSGLVAIAEHIPSALEHIFKSTPQLVTILTDIQDAGNVGAVIRSADAGGSTGVVTTGKSADPFGWKALRGAMGSTFRLPVTKNINTSAIISVARQKGLRILAAVPRGGKPLYETKLIEPTAIIFGGEGMGLDSNILCLADEHISVPMQRPVESLNVSVTAALVIYEAFRQRQTESKP